MSDSLSRRHFLQTSAALGFGLGLATEVNAFAPDSPEGSTVKPGMVRLRPEIEPVVRWIEEVPRDKILNVAVEKLREGLSYRELMAGLFLAGIRNIKPRPVGFKFHAVMVIHSAHLIGQTAAVDERLLPLLWALDTFKSSQAADVKEGDWSLGPVDEAKLPKPWQAKQEFVRAMEAWDAEAADAAIVSFCRSHGAAEVMEAFWRFALRDQRNIGHKAIFAAQSWRTLQAIGWQNAEPVLRSLTYGILDREGKPGTDVVGPYLENVEAAKKFPESWLADSQNQSAGEALLSELRSLTPAAAGVHLIEPLRSGVGPASIWDDILVGASELSLRKPGIVALHAVTSANALHFIYGAAGDETTRKLALLQGASWLALFRGAIGDAPDVKLDQLEPVEVPKSAGEALADIFTAVGTSREQAARKTIGFLKNGGTVEEVYAAARRMILLKGTDSHDFKFGAAAWEESLLANSPETRLRLTAGMMGHLPAATSADSPFMHRAREAVSAVLR